MKLTLKKLIWATVISLLLTASKLAFPDRWISPSDIKFWANDIAVIIAWGSLLPGKEKEITKKHRIFRCFFLA